MEIKQHGEKVKKSIKLKNGTKRKFGQKCGKKMLVKMSKKCPKLHGKTIDIEVAAIYYCFQFV